MQLRAGSRKKRSNRVPRPIPFPHRERSEERLLSLLERLNDAQLLQAILYLEELSGEPPLLQTHAKRDLYDEWCARRNAWAIQQRAAGTYPRGKNGAPLAGVRFDREYARATGDEKPCSKS